MKITVLDYGAGNVRSLVNAVEKMGGTIKMVEKPEDIQAAERLIFPGVGNYGAMLEILHERGFVGPLREYLNADRPFLGICVGMQALFEGSDEARAGSPDESIGFFRGRVERFRTELSVPHIGWNGIHIRQDAPFLDGIDTDAKFYFVHAYHVVPEETDVILTTTHYDYAYVSAVQRGNVIGTQFHPEKSGTAGMTLLDNFIHASSLESRGSANIPAKGLSKRVIACLDVRSNDNGDLVVTKGDQYDVREAGSVRNLGKPVALARKYYDQGADEITFLNITGFRDFPLEDMPMLKVLEQTSKQVFVPLTIGGGIREFTDTRGRHYSALDVAARYFRAGADKISIGSDAVYIAMAYLESGQKTGTSAIEEISRVYGAQAVVISIDPRRVWVASPENAPEHHVVKVGFGEKGPGGEAYCWYQCTVSGGRKAMNIDAVALARACEALGAGEILLNCIDKDGTNSGFDLDLINAVRNNVTIPVIASSGAGCEAHFAQVFTATKAEAALAAGIFHRDEVPIQSVKQHLAGQGIEVRK